MEAPSETAIRIMRAFLTLAAERGIEPTTTRAVAEEAGVNEVTIFRIFTDKETLIRAVYEHYGPGPRIAAYTPTIDIATAVSTREGLLSSLLFLRDCLREHPQFLLVSISEYWRFSALHEVFSFHHRAAHSLIEQALYQARPRLRKEVDLEITTLSWLGLLYITISWQSRGWITMTEEEWNHKLRAAIEPLLCLR